MKTNKEVLAKIKELSSKVSHSELSDKLADRFIKHEVIVEDIHTCLTLGKNAILQGAGGYAKSGLITAICNELKLPVNYLVCNESTTVEDILGPINLNKYLSGDAYEVDHEKSIFRQPGVLVLEEGFDAPADVLTCIKDVMSRKAIIGINDSLESLVSNVILITNIDSEVLKSSPSQNALLDRFTYIIDVDTNWSKHDYSALLKIYYPNIGKDMVDYLSLIFSSSNELITPRKAIDITEVVEAKGVEGLSRLINIEGNTLENMITFSDHRRASKDDSLTATSLVNRYNSIMDYYQSGKHSNDKTVEDLINLKSVISSAKVPSGVMHSVNEHIKKSRLESVC